MNINDGQLFEVLQGIQKGVAKVDANVDNLKDHLEAVSEKANDIRAKLDSHIESIDAHGVGAEQRRGNNTVAWAGAVLGLAGLLGPLIWEAAKHR